ncbi:MAG TPA: hypothetical protein VEK37_16025, partial [Gemmatimonadaceae bacterium]|nr:hypothetical protein [Gemmatimonadaceae bacterium]
MTGRVMRGIQKAGGAIRDGWLMLGVVALMLIGLETAYRAQGSLRRACGAGQTRQGAAKHPYADSSWFPKFER